MSSCVFSSSKYQGSSDDWFRITTKNNCTCTIAFIMNTEKIVKGDILLVSTWNTSEIRTGTRTKPSLVYDMKNIKYYVTTIRVLSYLLVKKRTFQSIYFVFLL